MTLSFESLTDFFNMGGYAFYIWLSYGFTFIALVILAINSKQKQTKVLNKIGQRLKREEKLKRVANEKAKQQLNSKTEGASHESAS